MVNFLWTRVVNVQYMQLAQHVPATVNISADLYVTCPKRLRPCGCTKDDGLHTLFDVLTSCASEEATKFVSSPSGAQHVPHVACTCDWKMHRSGTRVPDKKTTMEMVADTSRL
eukprot:4732091-Amphidinium_carterae.4